MMMMMMNRCQHFKAFNTIFSKVGRYASEEVVIC